MEKGKSTPAQPEYRKEKGLPVPVWFIAVIAIAAVAGIGLLPNLQQSASHAGSGISDAGASAGNQPQPPVAPAVTPVSTATETPTPTATKAQELTTKQVLDIPVEIERAPASFKKEDMEIELLYSPAEGNNLIDLNVKVNIKNKEVRYNKIWFTFYREDLTVAQFKIPPVGIGSTVKFLGILHPTRLKVVFIT